MLRSIPRAKTSVRDPTVPFGQKAYTQQQVPSAEGRVFRVSILPAPRIEQVSRRATQHGTWDPKNSYNTT